MIHEATTPIGTVTLLFGCERPDDGVIAGRDKERRNNRAGCPRGKGTGRHRRRIRGDQRRTRGRRRGLYTRPPRQRREARAAGERHRQPSGVVNVSIRYRPHVTPLDEAVADTRRLRFRDEAIVRDSLRIRTTRRRRQPVRRADQRHSTVSFKCHAVHVSSARFLHRPCVLQTRHSKRPSVSIDHNEHAF